ncbi:hypothetical protein KFE25_013270 [Diacronema lutheri]|uniref:Uncharacterized protein n=1 Tax=Diacronema lutheri TaxID=2081491 RepID=A0A8J6CB00_DIALT|nr:hypothetical protein KFE25_013270 [Diacronema lutheri]
MAAVEIGMYCRFADNPACGGVVFQLEGGVAGLRSLSQKLTDMGCGEETHEPLNNLQPVSTIKIGQRVFFKSDGPAASGEVFEFQDDGNVAGLTKLSQKLKDTGCGEQTHEPVENLAIEGEEM